MSRFELEPLVTVATYASPWEAQLARARLAAFGIGALVAGENAAGLYGGQAIGGVELRVREEEAGRATELLREQRPLPEIYLVTEEDARRPRCPRCRSEDVAYEGWFRRRGACHACGEVWKEEEEEPEAGLADLVTVARFRTPWEAHLARTLLESAGVDACVFEERLPPLNLLTGEALAANRVAVHADAADRAAALLEEIEAIEEGEDLEEAADE